MSESSWRENRASYTPTVLLGHLPGEALPLAIQELSADGWDVRVAPYGAPSASPAEISRALIQAAQLIQPDVVVVSGTEQDPWAFSSTRQLRSDSETHEVGLLAFSRVAVPEGLDVTPMSGPDGWIYGEEDPEDAVERIRQVMDAALEDRLEWARRDWTGADRRRYGMKSLALRVEHGQRINGHLMAEALFGSEKLVDLRSWDSPSSRPAGWRYGPDPRYHRPLLVHLERTPVEGGDVEDQQFILFSRSGRLLIAAANTIAELAGGWPTLE